MKARAVVGREEKRLLGYPGSESRRGKRTRRKKRAKKIDTGWQRKRSIQIAKASPLLDVVYLESRGMSQVEKGDKTLVKTEEKNNSYRK